MRQYRLGLLFSSWLDASIGFEMNTSFCIRVMVPVAVAIWTTGLASAPALGQDACTTYRMVYKTVYEQQPVTTYRLQYETVVREQQITESRPQWITETRERRYTVAKPVCETSTRIERHTVSRPVWETETRYQQHVVRKPVTQTVMQDRNYLTYEPVTTMKTQYVDRGSFVDQTVYKPGPVRNRLQWLPGTCAADPVTGTSMWQRGGLYWTPVQRPGRCEVQRVYVPNVVAQQVPQTNYVQKVVTQKVPVQVTSYVDEVVQQPVDMQVCKWVQQEVQKPITVTTQRIQYEERVEPVQVQVCRWITQTRKVQVPHRVAKWVACTTNQLVPRTVATRVPIDPCGSCAIPAYAAPVASASCCGTTAPSTSVETRKEPTEAKKDPIPDDSIEGAAGSAAGNGEEEPSAEEETPGESRLAPATYHPASSGKLVEIKTSAN